MNVTKVVRLAAFAALATACAPQSAAPPRPDEAAIRTALSTELAKFAPAIQAKDAAAFGTLFTEDATWILPDASTFTGRANIQTGAKNFFDTFETFVVDQTAIDKLVVISDSEAVTFAHANYTLTATGKAPAKRVNPVADLWKKGADGVWRITYELNADGPAPTAAATKP
ncbi:MAG: YybH family protein [Micromonosporaceae bacterium]